MSKSFQIDEVEKYIKQKNFGDTITFEELQTLTKYNLKDKFENYKFKANVIRPVKNRLIHSGIVIRSIRNIGYYILKPNQVQSYTYRTYIIKPLKHFEKAATILINSKTTELDEVELEKHNLTLNLDTELMEVTDKLIKNKKYSNLA